MANCAHCGSSLVFSIRKDKETGEAYCSARCQELGRLVVMSRQLPQELIAKTVNSIHTGLCPKCKGPGPIDMWYTHSIWSILMLSHWSTKPQICCEKCGHNAAAFSLITSFLFGWWGIPHGLIRTPIQISRNIGEISRKSSGPPSMALEKHVRMMLVQQVMAMQQGAPPG